jgi:predicted ATPase/DNA-binding SARP family transcriptional activator
VDIRLRFCGRVTVEADGQVLHESLIPGRHGRLALAYLTLERHRAVPREELAEALWPDALPASWSASLNSIVSKLRRLLSRAGLDGPAALEAAHGCYQLHLPDGTWVDAESALHGAGSAEEEIMAGDAAAAEASAAGVLEIAARPFLPSEEGSWVEERRTRLRDAHVRALHSSAQAHLALGRPAGAVAVAAETVSLEPFRESGYRLLMRAHAAAGDRAEALRVYERCRSLLAQELGTDPSPETQAAHVELLRREAAGIPAHDAAGDAIRGVDVPTPRSPGDGFIGREAELEDADRCLSESRLVTLTGPGGTGKTRLAVEVAARRPGAVWVIELAQLSDHRLLLSHVAGALGVSETAAQTQFEAVAAALPTGLLVLDNCEHLAAACARLVDDLLRSTPDLRVLTTSREPLDAPNERVLAVPPLSLEGNPSDAARLFLDHARRARPGFEIAPDELPVVQDICSRLGGLPLAIELAAARVGLLGVRDIASRLDLSLLEGGPRATRPAHRTMRDAIRWSYDVLDEVQRTLLRRVSVFVGGFTLADAEEVCAGAGIARTEVLRLLTRLAGASFVAARHRGGRSRFFMLEPIRRFAWEELADSGEEDRIRSRLLAHLAGQVPRLLEDATEEDLANLRAALGWAVDEAGDPASGLRLATDVCRLLRTRGHMMEARDWIERAIAALGSPELGHVDAYLAIGNTALEQGDVAGAEEALERALQVARAAGDDHGLAGALVALGGAALMRSDLARARALLEEGMEAGLRAGDDRQRVRALNGLARIAWQQGRLDAAIRLLEEGLVAARREGDDEAAAVMLLNQGEIVAAKGELDSAAELLEESLRRARAAGSALGAARALGAMGSLASARMDWPGARERFEECIRIGQGYGDQRFLAIWTANLAVVVRELGELDRAYDLWVEFDVLANRVGDRSLIAHGRMGLSEIFRMNGDLERAARLLREALRAFLEIGEHRSACACIESAAAIAVAAGDVPAAARMIGSAARAREELGAQPLPVEQAELDRIARACATSMAPDDMERARGELGAGDGAPFAISWLEGPLSSTRQRI